MNETSLPDIELDEIQPVETTGPTRVINDSNTKLFEAAAVFQPEITNPYFVVNEEGKPIGTANLEFVEGGIKSTLLLDHHTPERLLFETEPSRVVVLPQVTINIETGALAGVVVILLKG